MDESLAVIEEILREERGEIELAAGWKVVSYPKRQKKRSAMAFENGVSENLRFDELSEEHRLLVESQKAALDHFYSAKFKDEPPAQGVDDVVDQSQVDAIRNDGDETDAIQIKTKKTKKKIKKKSISVAEAAAKIDESDFLAFLAEITVSNEFQQDIQLLRFADYFSRAFASVTVSQFQWQMILNESPVSKMVDIPLVHIPEPIAIASMDWINSRSVDALGSFVLWSVDQIQAESATKDDSKTVNHSPSKSKAEMFVVLAMALRKKPDVLTSLVPKMKENSKFLLQDRLPITVWMIAQAAQGDLVVGLYAWANLLLPMINKPGFNPQSRDMILQLVERIISAPKARPILLNGASRKGERLVSVKSLEILMRSTFPPPSARIKATERLTGIYPILKEVALAGSPLSKSMKQTILDLFEMVMKLAAVGEEDLSKEASDISVWCLAQNPNCYQKWDDIYLDNVKASVIVLRKLDAEWSPACSNNLKAVLMSFRNKNKGAMEKEQGKSLEEAERQCKLILSKRFPRIRGCAEIAMFISVGLVATVAAAVAYGGPDSWEMFGGINSFTQ
ncbi:uncharacterized protein LOC124920571 [Impatiens glandulifera]|uniref:uncharacterized protein LOC124920571 n=1 Tax=Impatiens glandulifera TaxID=253017 RepID=UPI001FB0635C|nr:uncharacterized protein LOC124920571 [Impatiens glandulifera]